MSYTTAEKTMRFRRSMHQNCSTLYKTTNAHHMQKHRKLVMKCNNCWNISFLSSNYSNLHCNENVWDGDDWKQNAEM